MTAAATTLSREHISVNALKVVQRLAEHGYEAYLVGGCVRDLLLGKLPKDFDVATNAHPEEVHELFRNSRMIGRRFRIVHVRFGRDIIEVATFRGPHKEVDEDSHSETGMILDDNVYGTFKEDVFRRDFAMNALYYDAKTSEVIDLVDGLTDIKDKCICLIGEPEYRYREDPVRMLRAIRFKAKLDFEIDNATGSSINHMGYLLQDIPPARLFEEVLKLFMSGHGATTLEAMLEYDLFGWLFPATRRTMDDSRAEKLIHLALASTDKRIANNKPVTPAFIFAALLWYPFISEKKSLEDEGLTNVEASHEAAANVIANQQLFTSIPKRFSGPMRDIWNLQFRLPMRFGKKPEILVNHKRFRAAYDFLLLREDSGEKLDGLGDWWTRYQEADGEARNKLKQQTTGNNQKKRKRKRKRRSKQNNASRGNTIEGNTIEGNTIEGNTIEGNTIEGNTIEGNTIEGNTNQSGTSQNSMGNRSYNR
jgi:poly(A) polymerase